MSKNICEYTLKDNKKAKIELDDGSIIEVVVSSIIERQLEECMDELVDVYTPKVIINNGKANIENSKNFTFPILVRDICEIQFI